MLSVPVAMKAQEDLKFMRSSIYTILVNSEEQNTRLDKEAMDVDPEGYAETLKAAGISSLGVLPKQVFPTIAIPEQFYDHNLPLRVLDFDEIITGITPEQAKEARPKGGGFKRVSQLWAVLPWLQLRAIQPRRYCALKKLTTTCTPQSTSSSPTIK